MSLKPKARSGPGASVSVTRPVLRDLPRSTRRRQPTESEYEGARIEEISRRAELYELKLTELKANLPDRGEVETAFSEIASLIKQVIDGSKLTQAEKADVLSNLLTAEEFAANVMRQNAEAKGEASPVIGNGGIDEI